MALTPRKRPRAHWMHGLSSSGSRQRACTFMTKCELRCGKAVASERRGLQHRQRDQGRFRIQARAAHEPLQSELRLRIGQRGKIVALPIISRSGSQQRVECLLPVNKGMGSDHIDDGLSNCPEPRNLLFAPPPYRRNGTWQGSTRSCHAIPRARMAEAEPAA